MTSPRANIGDVIEFNSRPTIRYNSDNLVRGVIVDIVEDMDYMTNKLMPIYKACCMGDSLGAGTYILHLYNIDWDNYDIRVVNDPTKQ